MRGTIYFICFLSAISSSTCCTKNFSSISCIQDHKRKRKSCVQVATNSDEYIFFYCDKFLHRIESDCISKSGDADTFGETRLNQTHSTQRRLLKCDKRMHTLTGCWEIRGETRRIEGEEEDSEDSDTPNAETCSFKGNLVPKIVKLRGNPLHT